MKVLLSRMRPLSSLAMTGLSGGGRGSGVEMIVWLQGRYFVVPSGYDALGRAHENLLKFLCLFAKMHNREFVFQKTIKKLVEFMVTPIEIQLQLNTIRVEFCLLTHR